MISYTLPRVALPPGARTANVGGVREGVDMPATPLPPSGVPDGPKICDASGMADIHRMYKAGFGEAPASSRGVTSGDAAHAEVVAGQLELLSIGSPRSPRRRGRAALGTAHRARAGMRCPCRAHEAAPRRAAGASERPGRGASGVAATRIDPGCRARARRDRRSQRGARRAPSGRRGDDRARRWRRSSRGRRSSGSGSTAARRRPRVRPGTGSG